jgi:putative PEP-CTERM system TPR-repeat lipoprotein
VAGVRHRQRRLDKHEVERLPAYRPRSKERRRAARKARQSAKLTRLHIPVVLVLGAALAAGATSVYLFSRGEGLESQLSSASVLVEKGHNAQAVSALKTLLVAHPDDPQARWMLGNALLALEDGVGALKEFERAEAEGFRDAALFTNKLVALLVAGEYQKVQSAIIFVSDVESSALVLEIRARAQLGLGRTEQARETLERVVSTPPVRAQSRAWLGRVALAQGDLDAAAKQADLLRTLPNPGTEGWLLAGEVSLARSDAIPAQRAFEQALEVAPELLAAKFGLARALLLQGHVESTQELLEPILARVPDHPIARFLSAHAATARGDNSVAITHAQSVIGKFPKHPPTLMLLGTLHLQRGEYAPAELMLSRILAADNGNLLAQKLMASVELGTGRASKALSRLEALPGVPKNGGVNDNVNDDSAPDSAVIRLMATAHIHLDQTNNAIELLEPAHDANGSDSELTVELAFAHLAAGELNEGRNLLLGALANDSKNSRAYLLLALTELELGNSGAAMTALETLAPLDANNPTVWHLMGLSALQATDPKTAYRHFLKSIEHDPNYIPAHWSLAQLEQARGKAIAARGHYREILRLDPDHTEVRLALARLEIGDGHPERATVVLENLLSAQPLAVDAARLLSKLQLNAGKIATASATIEQAWKHSPTLDLSVEFADLLIAGGHYRRVVEVLTNSVDPDDPRISARLHIARAFVGEGSLASTLLQTPAQTSSNANESTLLRAAISALDRNQLARAEAISRSLATQHPNSPNAELILGDTFLARGQTVGALNAYARALDVQPLPSLLRQIVRGWLEAKRHDKAENAIRRYRQTFPDDPLSDLLLAEVALFQGDLTSAKTGYEQALALSPHEADALNNLAWVYHRLGDARSLTLAEDAYRLKPNSAAIADTLGWILVDLGQTRRGRTLLEKALVAEPTNPSMRYHLAVALVRMDTPAQARRLLKELHQDNVEFPERDDAQALLLKLGPAG